MVSGLSLATSRRVSTFKKVAVEDVLLGSVMILAAGAGVCMVTTGGGVTTVAGEADVAVAAFTVARDTL